MMVLSRVNALKNLIFTLFFYKTTSVAAVSYNEPQPHYLIMNAG